MIEPDVSRLEDLDADDDVVSAKIRGFLVGRGIQRHKQVLELSKLLGVARSSIHRKFKGDSAWSQEELHVISDHFGVTVEQLTGIAGESLSEHAALRIPKMPSTGMLIVGDPLDSTDICDLVAIKALGGWEVYPIALAPKGPARYSVRSLTVSAGPYMRVALLEDNQSVVESLVDALKDFGFAVTGFRTTDDFLNALPGGRFQAYIVDWDLGGQTAERALTEIRAMESRTDVAAAHRAPIFVTTGVLKDGDVRATEAALLPICDRLNAAILEKPVRTSVLAAHIRREVSSINSAR